MNSNDAMKRARQHHHAGALPDAEKIYRQILQDEPNHPEALQLLGALVGQRGDIDAAILLIQKSISFNPKGGEAHRNLGVMFAKRQRFDEALAAFSQAAELRRDDPLIQHNIAKILTIQGKFEDAVATYQRVVQLNPDVAEIHREIGNLLGKLGRFDEAATAFSKAVQLQPDSAMAHFGLGNVHRSGGHFEEGLASFREAVRIKPDFFEAHAGMAMILAQLHRFDEAMACHARADQLKPDSAGVHEVLGWILVNKNDGAAAIEQFRRAIAVDPNLLSAWNSLGLALQYQGHFEEAAECFRHVLAVRPNIGIARKHLVNTTRQGSDTQIEPLLNLLREPNLSIEDRASAGFALGTALDRAGRFDEAFPHFAMANALVKKQMASLGDRYDADDVRLHVDRLIELFTPEFFEKRRSWGDPSEVPVFIVGMPRSGTTLAHQIAASHPQVYGAGELNEIKQLSKNLNDADTPRWSPDSVKQAASDYLKIVREMSAATSRIVDKFPSNLHFLGLIAVLFPRARVVLCRRDPRDTCLSCYFQAFATGNIFSIDLADCGHYHRENDRLAAHWLKVLPLSILEFHYEQVVADLEGQSRRLIEFLGLPWDSACLEFYLAKSTVVTSSVWQVRQPIYQGSVARWRHYEKYLGPLFSALDTDDHKSLGLTLAKQGRFDEAFAAFSRAAELTPDDPLVHRNLAKIFAIQRRWDEALAAYRRVVQLKPELADTHKEIGDILARQGRFDEAIAAYSNAFRVQPNFAAAFVGLGDVYRVLGQFKEGLAACRQALRINPDMMEAHVCMAIIFAMTEEFDKAIASHARALHIKPDSAINHEVFGWIMLCKNDGAAAADHFRRAIAVDPKQLSAWNSLGLAQLYQGQFDEAAESFRHVLAIDPDNALARKHLVNTSRRASNAEIEPLLTLTAQPGLSIDERISAEFGLATALDDAGRFDEAFTHAALANSLVKQQRAAVGDRYDSIAFHTLVDRLIEVFTPEFLSQRRGWGDPSELPVFVVGMPRSGTTLVQQIAASHPQAFGAGELNNIANLATILKEPNPLHWSANSVKTAAREHVDFLRSLSSAASRVIDKMPANLHNLGLISLLFPRARIVFCRRDARDTCLSCYFQSFFAGNIFSYDLADCGHYHRENDRLAAHWLKTLPMAMLEVRYEEVVADPQAQSRRLIDFLGLPWDPACLEFHRTKTTVRTLSFWQVRQPIYHGSVGRWRHYGKFLGPLFQALGE